MARRWKGCGRRLRLLLAAAAIFPGPLSRAAEVAALPEPIRALAPMSVRGINCYP